MYESPINIILGEMSISFDDEIIKAVRKFDVQVDKDELIKALNYDRQQYEEGFNDCMKQYVVCCKDCAEWDTEWQPLSDDRGHYCSMLDSITNPEFYCSHGERRKDVRGL